MQSTDPRLPWLVLATSLLICFGTWRWAEKILAPSNTHFIQSHGILVGNNSDLYARWLGTRELLLHGRDAYSAEVTRQIQTGFYGRPLDPRNPADPTAEEGFIYPLYVVFLMAPTLILPFPTVQAIFRWLLLLALACSVPLWMHALRWRPKPIVVLSGMVLAISSSPAIVEYHQQNLAAAVVFLLAAGAALAVRGWNVLAGCLLAFSTIKPDLSWLVIVWFLAWAIGRWKERQSLVWSFCTTMLLLIVAAEAVSPHWLSRFFAAVFRYPTHGANPILYLLMPQWLAVPVAVVLLGWLLLFCWKQKTATAGSAEFVWALAWAAALTVILAPNLAPYNQSLLIPSLLLLLIHRSEVFAHGVLTRSAALAAFACPMWQWTAALVLSLTSLFIAGGRLESVARIPVYTVVALPPLTLLAMIAGAPRKPILKGVAGDEGTGDRR